MASTAEKLKFCQFHGADFAIDYTTPDWPDKVNEITGGVGADIIYDTVGGSITKLAITALAPGDELFFAAVNRFNLESSDLETMILKNQSIKGFALLPLLRAATLRDDLSELFELVQTRNLNVTIGGRFPLHQASDAHRALESRSTTGKIILVP